MSEKDEQLYAETKEKMFPQPQPINLPENAEPTRSYGETRLRVFFNPSKLSVVDEVNKHFVAVMNILEEEKSKPGGNYHKGRELAHAQTKLEEAKMTTVLALTNGLK